MTQSKTISITRALSELKSLKDRIEKSYEKKLYVGFAVGQGDLTRVANTGYTSLSIDQLKEEMIANMQSTQDLINYRNALKSAVLKANNSTVVTIMDKTITIAEAIEMKKSIAVEEAFVLTLRRQRAAMLDAFENQQSKLDNAITEAQNTICGSDRKIDEEVLKSIAAPQRARFTPSIVDPNKLQEYIDKKIAFFDEFKSSIDFILSEINAKTEITVTW